MNKTFKNIFNKKKANIAIHKTDKTNAFGLNISNEKNVKII